MSPDILSLLRLKPKHWVGILVVCLGTLAPGTLILFIFKPDLFLSLDFGRVSLLAVSLTIPLVMLNVPVALPDIMLNGKIGPDSDDPIDPGELYMAALMRTSIALYTPLAIAYFLALTFKMFCVWVAVIEIILAARAWMGILWQVKKG